MKQLNLSIPNSCHEKWETFTSTANGSFCSSCSKVIVDFTHMSDDDVIGYFLNNPLSTCGRFRANQLKTYKPTSMLKINPGTALLKAGFIGAVLLLAAKPVSARNPFEKTKTEVVHKHSALEAINPREQHTIKGIVRSADDGSVLPGVNVVLQGSTIGTVTDSEGSFVFPIELKEGDVLLFSFVGLKTQEFKIPKHTEGLLEIKMEMTIEILGEVSVSDVYSAKPSGIAKLWSRMKNFF